MLFTVNDDSLFNDFFNISNDYNNVLDPKEGLTLGNMFKDEYIPYKNYKPRLLSSNNERDRELLLIRQLCFAVIDLNLKLDTDPNNRDLFNLFKKYNKELNERIENYSLKYNVLDLNYDTKDKYTWYQNPWPWEESKYV